MEYQSQKIISLIEVIVPILNLCDTRSCEWYRGYLEKILLQLNRPHELYKIAEDILKIYGGMGSFNDTGIYKNSEILAEEHSKFDKLCTELFLACENAIATSRQGQ